MDRIVLQGSVFGPIKCAVQMDTLGREALQSGIGILKYKDTIDVPALAMIDDVMGMASCGDNSIELNAIINSKMESKKLRLSGDKCFKIHISKRKTDCSQILKVHESSMKNVSQATYLGDVISENGTINETIVQRSQKSIGITSQITSMLASISLGSFHFDIALVMREAKFINSVMTNSEIWHNVQLANIQSLEKCDSDLLKKILNAHSKTAYEAYFLELAIYPLRYTLAIRRFMYLWHILHRDKSELIRKVYDVQSCNITKGDWVQIMQQERVKYNIMESDQTISTMSQEKFRSVVKTKVYTHAVQYIHDLAEPHSKSEKIVNPNFKRREYFSDRRFTKEDVQLLFSLRTRMLNCKSNFRNQFNNDLTCRICKVTGSIEDEDHILTCSEINDEVYDAKFEDVYGNVDNQQKVVQVFKKVLRKRKIFMEIAEKTAKNHPSS